ncbi:MAG: TIGR00159 family protein [Phycisphaerae bacterium]|nr:TIGR00159 family protein [Phycisphaerae bacterium]
MDQLRENLSNFITQLRGHGPSVLFEMLIIGSVVYWIVRFLRGTRGARMLRGIAFVLISVSLIMQLVANQLGLGQIDYLYRQFLTIASMVVVVVFQPELRRALMRLGETRLFRGLDAETSDDIDELVKTAIFCSRNKIGALVALERDVGLGGIAESGTRINADLTAELLETIFFPNTPLHDLGVIVSQGRVMWAGVQFPLAESGDVQERELGSRHRAAVGMSQESDAVVLVVSEETGDISIAERGRLIRKITSEALRDLLAEMLHRAASPTDDESEKKSLKEKQAA